MGLSLLLVSLLTLVEFNCENLFDCQHDSLKEDLEFTPQGNRRWTEKKYRNKLDNIARAVITCGDGDEWRLPDIVALCEVENDLVMRDLTGRTLIRNAGYEYVMTSSPDVRGIDVALMYRQDAFAPVRHYPLRVEPPDGMRPTRDILYVAGRVVTGDTLHLFVVHAPSRFGGEKPTRAYRMAVAGRLCEAVDSLRGVCREPCIIVAGDFNDYGSDPSLVYLQGHGLTDISANATGSNGAGGTYKYKGRWGSLDHILVYGRPAAWLQSCNVCDAPFLLEPDAKYGGVQPYRTFRGWQYRNAYSDHLPLVARFLLP